MNVSGSATRDACVVDDGDAVQADLVAQLGDLLTDVAAQLGAAGSEQVDALRRRL